MKTSILITTFVLLSIISKPIFSQYLSKGVIIGINNECHLFKTFNNTQPVDTIYDKYKLLIFEVISDEPINNLVKVRINEDVFKNLQSSSHQNVPYWLPIEEPFLEFWVNTKQLAIHSVPDFIYSYSNNDEKILNQIIKNCEWQKVYNSEEYLSCSNDHAIAYRSIAKIHLNNELYEQAVTYATKSIDIIPSDLAYNIRAISKYILKDFRGSIKDCNHSISFDPFSERILSLYNFFDNIEEVNEYSSDNINIYAIKGFCYFDLEQFDNALPSFDSAILKTPEKANLYYWRGLTKLNLNKKNEGCLDLSKAGELGMSDAYEIISKYCQ